MSRNWDDYYKQLRENIDIEELVGQFVEVRNHRCRCPFHDDHHPSMVLFPKTQTWRCMACGKGGSTIDFVMEHEMLDFKGACEWLGSRYAIEKPRAETQRTQSSSNKKKSRMKQEMDKIQQIMERQNRRHCSAGHTYCHSERNAVESKNLTPQLGISNVCNSRILACGKRQSRAGGRSFDCAQDDIKDDIICFEYEIAQSFCSTDNSFSQCMLQLFSKETVERVTNDYLLGCYGECGNEDDVLFPSIDACYELRDMKIQHYCTDPASERFFHCDKKHIYWWGSLPSVAEKIPAGLHIDRDCLFGEHLLTKYPDRTVVLVESPKNACIGAALCPEMVWVATGNKTQMKPRVLEALRGRDVLVIPDRDAIAEWSKVIGGLGSLANFRMSGINEVLMQGDNEKCDVADIIISNLTPSLSEGEGEPSGSCHSEQSEAASKNLTPRLGISDISIRLAKA